MGGARQHTVVRVLVVRHGESTWNALGRWQGHADPPLSPTGAAQARAAAPALKGIDEVWCSDLLRAHQTAELCAPATVLHVDPLLRERDVGEWTGLTRATIEERYPGWLAEGRRPDGWETDERLADRAWRALRGVVAALDPGRQAVVVSHGGLIRAVEASFGAPSRPVPNLRGVWLHHSGSTFELGERAALVGLGPPETAAEPAAAAPE